MNIDTHTLIHDFETLGWKRFPRKRTDIAIYQYYDNERLLQVTIPLDKALSDYDEAMLNTLKSISDFKRVNLASIIKEYSI